MGYAWMFCNIQPSVVITSVNSYYIHWYSLFPVYICAIKIAILTLLVRRSYLIMFVCKHHYHTCIHRPMYLSLAVDYVSLDPANVYIYQRYLISRFKTPPPFDIWLSNVPVNFSLCLQYTIWLSLSQTWVLAQHTIQIQIQRNTKKLSVSLTWRVLDTWYAYFIDCGIINTYI